MPIAVDAVSSSSTANAASLTFSHLVSGANRILIVSASSSDAVPTVPTGVTYNSVAMTKIAERVFQSFYESSMWQLVNPDVGSHSIVVTWSGAQNKVGAGGVSFTGVDQVAPLGTSVQADGNTTLATVDATSADGEMVVDGIIDDSLAFPITSFQTQQWELHADNSYGQATASGASTVTMSWNVVAGTRAWGIIAVPLKPAADATNPTFAARAVQSALRW